MGGDEARTGLTMVKENLKSLGLRCLRPARQPDDRQKAIVFVHGILSSHRTFDGLIAEITKDPRFLDWNLLAFDYDWGQPIRTSAGKLRRSLNDEAYSEVTLIGHSMGGLVSRFALIDGLPLKQSQRGAPSLPCVRRIIMLGTPNFGTLTSGQVGVLLQEAMRVVGLTPIFPRKKGLSDLRKVQTIYNEIDLHTGSAPVLRAEKVEYLTIPGLYYYPGRDDLEQTPGQGTFLFAGVSAAFAVLSCFPPARANLAQPHDGIVEASSVDLRPRSGRLCEKSSAIQDPATFGDTYRHVEPKSMYNCTHMKIQSDKAVSTVLRDLIHAGSFQVWLTNQSKVDRLSMVVYP